MLKFKNTMRLISTNNPPPHFMPSSTTLYENNLYAQLFPTITYKKQKTIPSLTSFPTRILFKSNPNCSSLDDLHSVCARLVLLCMQQILSQ